jgi:probable LLM family oxidoreductase
MPDVLAMGLDTFGDVTVDPHGTPKPHPEVIRDLVEEAVLADEVGIDAIGIGEHHRPDFAVSAPDVVLAGIATRTSRILLGSAVTVLSSDDPIRVFQRFATVDALSRGRAEVTLGRGSFIESFPLFGFDLGQYEELFSEKLDLFAALLDEEPVVWEGQLRPPLQGQRVYPTTATGLKVWIGVGGSPESVVRAARYNIPLVLAIIGGPADRFVPFADLYRRALDELGRPHLPIAVHSPGFVADTDEEARELAWPHYRAMHDRIGAERGWGPSTRSQYDLQAGPMGALYVGSPETVARKIAATARLLGLARFDLKYSMGTLPHPLLMRCIELYGTKVVPLVRDMLSEPAG